MKNRGVNPENIACTTFLFPAASLRARHLLEANYGEVTGMGKGAPGRGEGGETERAKEISG